MLPLPSSSTSIISKSKPSIKPNYQILASYNAQNSYSKNVVAGEHLPYESLLVWLHPWFTQLSQITFQVSQLLFQTKFILANIVKNAESEFQTFIF